MNMLKTFENRISTAFSQGAVDSRVPFSFKKLAKMAARELEHETFEIAGVDTAPALYTVLVSATDDAQMRPLYGQLANEICAFVEGEAKRKSYRFVGRPLARFMVDPQLKRGKFAIFAENIDATTLSALREEEERFLQGSLGLGGAAKVPEPYSAPAPQVDPLAAPSKHGRQKSASALEFAPVIDDVADASAGLNVVPLEYDAEAQAEMIAPVPTPAPQPVVPVAAPVMDSVPPIPKTQRRNVPLVNARRATPVAEVQANEKPSCLLIDHQSGMTYTAYAPVTIVGREKSQGAIVLKDPNISRRHAELSFDGRAWHITDLRSTNGTMVNNQDIDTATLSDGDLITLGLLNLEFRGN